MKPKIKEVAQITTASLTQHFMELLKIYKILGWREHMGGLRAGHGRSPNPKTGFPDLAGITQKGRFWVAEIKGPKDTLKPKQIDWLSRLEASEALTCVIRSYEDSSEFIAKILRN